MIGATLANHGVHPVTGEQVVAPDVVRDMISVALTCGMYDYAGEWAFTVGIPAKSGVGGGILGVLPGVGGLATYSPRLDEYGNSVRGVKVFEELSARFTLHLFDPDRPWQRPSTRRRTTEPDVHGARREASIRIADGPVSCSPTVCRQGAGTTPWRALGSAPVLLALDVAPAAGTGGDAVEHHAQEHRQCHGRDSPPDFG